MLQITLPPNYRHTIGFIDDAVAGATASGKVRVESHQSNRVIIETKGPGKGTVTVDLSLGAYVVHIKVARGAAPTSAPA